MLADAEHGVGVDHIPAVGLDAMPSNESLLQATVSSTPNLQSAQEWRFMPSSGARAPRHPEVAQVWQPYNVVPMPAFPPTSAATAAASTASFAAASTASESILAAASTSANNTTVPGPLHAAEVHGDTSRGRQPKPQELKVQRFKNASASAVQTVPNVAPWQPDLHPSPAKLAFPLADQGVVPGAGLSEAASPGARPSGSGMLAASGSDWPETAAGMLRTGPTGPGPHGRSRLHQTTRAQDVHPMLLPQNLGKAHSAKKHLLSIKTGQAKLGS